MKVLCSLLLLILSSIFYSVTAKTQPVLKLTADTELSAGGMVKVTITVPEGNKKTLLVTIAYGGTGVPDIAEKLHSVIILPNEHEVEFNVRIGKIIGKKDKKITISAQSAGFKSSNLLTIQLSREVIESKDGILALPPEPKITIKNEKLYINLNQKTKARCSSSLKGFWISCKLKLNCFKILNSGVTNYKDIVTDRIYLWIPLKQNSPLYYYATTEYVIGGNFTINYNEKKTLEHIVETGYTSNSSNSHFVSALRSTSKSYSSSEEAELRASIEAGLGVGGGGFGSSVSVSDRKTNVNQFGFSSETGSTDRFESGNNLSTLSRFTCRDDREGPKIPGFVKVYVPYYPKVIYSLEDLDKTESINIGYNIDYGGKKFLCFDRNEEEDVEYCDNSIKNYIAYLFSKNPFSEDSRLKGHYTERLSAYLKKFSSVNTLNPNLKQKLSTILTDQDYVEARIDSYSIGLSDFEVSHGNSAKPSYLIIEKPTNCGLITNLHHQFAATYDNKPVSRFLWEAPISATDFQLEIKKENESWDNKSAVHIHPVSRGYHQDTKYPISQVVYDEDKKQPNDIHVNYVARLQSKCGPNSGWSEYSDEVTFTYDRTKYQVGSITITPLSQDFNYSITWDAVVGAEGYYVEYANANVDFSEIRHSITPGPGKTHPFDILHSTNIWTYTSQVPFKIKITPKCNGMKGIEKVQFYSSVDKESEGQDSEVQLVCPALLDAPIVNFRKHLNTEPVFKWTAPVGATCFKLEIKSKENSWGDNDITHLIDVEFDTQTRRPKAINFQDEQTDYQEGSQYVARVASKCFNISDDWTVKYSPEKEFKIPVKSTRIKTNNSLSSIGTSFAKKAPRNRRSNESKPSTLPELEPVLRIAPNPVTEMLTFSITNLQKPANEIEIRLHGVLSGQVLHSERRTNIGAGEVQVINKNLSFGNYILVVILDGQKKLTQQFLKQ